MKAGFWCLSYDDLTSFATPGEVSENHQRFCCPLCGHDKPRNTAHQSLSLNVFNSRWQCWRCGCWGILGITFNGELLPVEQRTPKPAHLSGPVLPKPKPIVPWRQKYADVLARLQPLPGTHAQLYGHKRGLTSDTLASAPLKHCADFLGGAALVFPVLNQQRNLVAVQGRYLSPKSNQPKTRTLGVARQGVFWTRGAWSDPRGLVLCEAPIDALSLHQLGRPAIASLGVSLMPRWVLELCAGQSVALATDNDEAGERAAHEWAKALIKNQARPVRARPPEPFHDWNEYLQSQNQTQSPCPIHSSPTPA